MKQFFFMIQATVEDDNVIYDHADGYWVEYVDAFPHGTMLVIDDDNPMSGHFEIARNDEDVETDDMIFRDLRKKLNF